MSRILMSASAAVLGALGFGLLFTPMILGRTFGFDFGTAAAGQLMGTAALGFAVLNWLARGAAYGGTCGRPIVVANFVYAFVTAMVLIRRQLDSGGSMPGWMLSLFYLACGIGFAVLMGRTPKAGADSGS